MPPRSGEIHRGAACIGIKVSSASTMDYSPVRDRLIRDTLIYLAGRAVPAVLLIVSVPVFARTLGAEDYGLYALFAALALTVGNTTGAWIGQAVLRFASRLRQWTGGTLERALNRALFLAVLGSSTATALGGLLLPSSLPMLGASMLVAGSMAAYALAAARHQAALRAGRVSSADVLRVGVTVGIPTLAMFGFGMRDPVILLLGAAAGNLLAASLLSWGRPGEGGSSLRTTIALGTMMKFGAPIAGWMLVATLLNLSDRYLIEVFIGTSAVGSYAAVYDIVFKGVVFLFTPMLMAAHPMIMDAWNRREGHEARSLLHRTLTYTTVVGGIATLSIWVLADIVLPVVLGEVATPGAIAVAGPVAAGSFLWQIGMLSHKRLELAQRTWLMLGLALLALTANVCFNIFMLPRLGLVAAGYGTMLGAGVYLALTAIYGAAVAPWK